MTASADRESLIAAMNALRLTRREVADRLGAPLDTIRDVCARRIWEWDIPDEFLTEAAEIIEEAERNGQAYAGAAEPALGSDRVTDDPIKLPEDDSVRVETAIAEPSVEQEGAAEDEPAYTKGELLTAARALEEGDTAGAYAIMKESDRARVNGLDVDDIAKILAKKLGQSPTQIKTRWKEQTAKAAAKIVIPPTAQELAERAQKPRLEIQEGHPDRTVTNLRDILATSGRLFERGAPVRIVSDQDSDGSVAHQLTVPGLVLETHFVCQPWKFDRKSGEKDVDLPASHAQMYLAWRGERNLPPLNGFTTAPILSSDGSIRTARGYDAATGLFCERVPDVAPLVPANPTRREAEAALLLVRDVAKTFPFKDAITRTIDGVKTVDLRQPPGMDESSFLTSLLGSVCRPSLWLGPGSLFEGAKASGSGVGKGLLVRIVCAIAYGRLPIAVGPGGNTEELEKRISAALLQGGPMIFLDNFNDLTLKSSALESALTERPSQVRQFGTLDMVAINSLASVFVTGNAIELGLDSVRRFVRTEFDAQVEDAEGRIFSGDILAEVMANRSAILAALLTIWRYGRLAPDIRRGLALGSYEQWGEWARDPLLTLGCRDPVARLRETKLRDPERQTIGELFTRWWEIYKSEPKPASEVTDYEIGKIINPQGKERQFVVAVLGKFVGSRVAGFVMTRQAPVGHWGRATFALQKTENEGDGGGDGDGGGCTTSNPMPPTDPMVLTGTAVRKNLDSQNGESDDIQTAKNTNQLFPGAGTGENHRIRRGHRGVQPSGDPQSASVSKPTNTTGKVPPSRNPGEIESPDASGEPPGGAHNIPPELDAAAPPLSGVLVDGVAEPIPESILKIATEARAAMATVAARAAAAEAARADKEQSASQKRRKPK